MTHVSRARPPLLKSLRRHVAVGCGVCLLLVGGAGSWAVTAELAGAIVAPGTVIVEGHLKAVQHPTGGIVGQLGVREGDKVQAGDVLLRLDDTIARANLSMISKNLDELTGRRARLEAERDEAASITFPIDLVARTGADPDTARLVEGEERLFAARRASLAGQTAQLRERATQLAQEIEGLNAQHHAKTEQAELIKGELEGVTELYEKNLIPLSRLTALQREASRLEGERGQIVASLAQAAGRIAETELQIIQLSQDLRTEVLKELREIAGRISELVERKITAEDQMKRIDLRAPLDGTVHQLAVHTIGGVIAPGDVVMSIVPRGDALVIEAKVMPQDIDQVVVGQDAVIRLPAFNQRTTPELNGNVVSVSADLLSDRASGLTWYSARIRLSDQELARLGRSRLQPGMPAEVHIRTQSRTAMSYFSKPLTDQFARAFREE